MIAAVVIGGASLSGGSGTIAAPSCSGALLMATLANGCNLSGVPNYVQEILIGGIIVARWPSIACGRAEPGAGDPVPRCPARRPVGRRRTIDDVFLSQITSKRGRDGPGFRPR